MLSRSIKLRQLVSLHTCSSRMEFHCMRLSSVLEIHSCVTFWHTALRHFLDNNLFHDLKCLGTWVISIHLVAELCLRICVSLRVCGNSWFIKLYLHRHCPLWIATFNSVMSLITHCYVVIIHHFVHRWLTTGQIHSYTLVVEVFLSLDEFPGYFLWFPLRCIEYMNMWMYLYVCMYADCKTAVYKNGYFGDKSCRYMWDCQSCLGDYKMLTRVPATPQTHTICRDVWS
jgi:hypothetical protein